MTPSPGTVEPVLLVSRALPLQADGQGDWRPRPGGLSTALLPGLRERDGSWLGWHPDPHGLPDRVPNTRLRIAPVALPDEARIHTLDGFATRTLWPLLHDMTERPVIDEILWAGYRELNGRFADVVVEQLADWGAGPAPVVWVHDHELLLVPGLVRRQLPDVRIGLFLHTPWPAPELFARLPWRRPILEGMLAADAVSFQVERYRKNFARTCGRLVPEADVEDDIVVVASDRRVQLTANPTSIDARGFAADATSDAVTAEAADLTAQFPDTRVLLGVDRQDYTKGILERLGAVERLMDRRPELLGTLTLVQIGVPSRVTVPEYQDLAEEIARAVGHINGRFTVPGGPVPIHYLNRGVTRHQLLAYYRLADVLLVTALKDGMNLVAKEYVVCQHAAGGAGALVLSEFAGAHDELVEAVTCNPFDVDELSRRIETAIELDSADRRSRVAAMAGRVIDHDAQRWMQQELTMIGSPGTDTQRPAT